MREFHEGKTRRTASGKTGAALVVPAEKPASQVLF